MVPPHLSPLPYSVQMQAPAQMKSTQHRITKVPQRRMPRNTKSGSQRSINMRLRKVRNPPPNQVPGNIKSARTRLVLARPALFAYRSEKQRKRLQQQSARTRLVPAGPTSSDTAATTATSTATARTGVREQSSYQQNQPCSRTAATTATATATAERAYKVGPGKSHLLRAHQRQQVQPRSRTHSDKDDIDCNSRAREQSWS